MVNKCSAYGCIIGNANSFTDPTVTFHRYPLGDQKLCDRCIRENPRKDFILTKNSRICSLHFHAIDFVTRRMDSNKRRLRRYNNDTPLRR